jgi:hypothetical protein
MCLYSQALLKLTISQDFDAIFPFLDDPNTFQELGRYYSTSLKPVQRIQVYNRVFFSEYIGETTRWQSSLNRHLAAFKPWRRFPAGAR